MSHRDGDDAQDPDADTIVDPFEPPPGRLSLPHEELEGAVLGDRYSTTRRIGTGGMAAVYAGVDTETGRRIAVKVLNPTLCRDRVACLRFDREARALAALSHPNVVELLDVDVTWTPPFIVMELLDGMTLTAALRRGPFAIELAVDVVGQVLAGVSAAHDLGMVHRDLKPGNVMIVDRGGRSHAKILDFGVATILTDAQQVRLTASNATIGTPSFMAPEQIKGGKADPRSDVHAIGALLFSLLTGKKPFEGDIVDLMRQVVFEEAPSVRVRRPECPPALDAVVGRAMSKEPDARFQSAHAMAAALRAAV
jgi:serine/threonine-protein kinase